MTPSVDPKVDSIVHVILTLVNHGDLDDGDKNGLKLNFRLSILGADNQPVLETCKSRFGVANE